MLEIYLIRALADSLEQWSRAARRRLRKTRADLAT